ncbi:MAG TPA: nitrate reductase molybdenum cofactor assembly chaperone [Methylibium sp.]|nr:nitrate reductase molybdenum cofactor assembly chaperone [Methylibium sp.]
MKTTPMTLTLRALAHLLGYPDAALRNHLGELSEALHRERALGPDRLAELDALIARLAGPRTYDTEAAYVETFDRGRGTALHLFEHVHGDSRDRGPAMVDLVKTYEAAGLFLAPDELPDHLTVVLEYASTQPPAAAAEFLREIAHILQAIFSALLRRQSAYASVIAAVLDLAGEKAQAVKLPTDDPQAAAWQPPPPAGARPAWGGPAPAEEPTLDESWEEPPAFGGCSTQGQARPGQPQPIRIVKPAPGARA